jgi:AcrR family transcriptional regulator
VQQVLDRAGVGRATFYAHFRNKHDLLLSDYERMLAWLDTRLAADPVTRRRVAPVAEFLAHLEDAARLLRALRESGQMELMWELAAEHFARTIERRIRLLAPAGTGAAEELVLGARLCAGALVEMIKWWLDRDARPSPVQMDDTFHRFVWRALHGPAPMRTY